MHPRFTITTRLLKSTPFGSEIKIRRYSAGKYRFGFSGHEKDNEIKGEGYSTDFGERMLDTRLDRWLSVDPLAYEFPSMSPYCAFANNPIYYTDPDGREIVDPKGKKVTYTVGKDGSLIWSKNATADIQRIGNAMARSEEGLKQLGSMQSARHKIYLNIDSKSKPNKLGYTEKTYTWYMTNKTFEISKAVVTIYDAKLKDFADKINNGSVGTTDQSKMYAKLSNDIDGMIAAVASHEAVHAADKTNIKQSIHNQKLGTKYDTEKTPEEVEDTVLKQLIEKQEKKEEAPNN